MTKLKSPLISMGAQGGLGDNITFARRRGVNLVEKKPIPANPQSLPQVYQRWLYEDYAHLWTQQAVATKQTYASAGVRFHLTGFQYWMKYCLTELPWLSAYWKLDESTGPTAYDSSSNNLDLTIIGATPTTLRINGAYYFDGLNDTLRVLNTIPDVTGSVEFFINTTDDLLGIQSVLGQTHIILPDSWINFRVRGNRFTIERPGAWSAINHLITADTLYHVCFTCDGVTTRGYIDGLEHPLTNPAWTQWFSSVTTPDRIHIGVFTRFAGPVIWYKGYLDQLAIHNRILDLTTIQRHAGRRYPLK